MRFSLLIVLICVNYAIMASEPIAVKTDAGTLYGELELPDSCKSCKVVLIIAGSGPTDRNGNSQSLQGKNNSLAMLAQGLKENGVASLRYDKRGIGLSEKAGMKEADLTFDRFVQDAAAWINLLANDDRLGEIFVLGHSQGALIATLLANNKAYPIKGVISLSGTSTSADVAIAAQLKSLPDGLRQEAEQILAKLQEGDTTQQMTVFLQPIFRPSIQPFLMSWMKYDPRKEMQQLAKPCLVIHGVNDIQLPDWHADSLANTNSLAKLYKIEGMNHVLKDAPMSRAENLATYTQPELPVSAGLCDAIASFVKSVN